MKLWNGRRRITLLDHQPVIVLRMVVMVMMMTAVVMMVVLFDRELRNHGRRVRSRRIRGVVSR